MKAAPIHPLPLPLPVPRVGSLRQVSQLTVEVLALGLAAVIAAAAALLELGPIVRAPAGLLATLVLPGWALSLLVLPRALDRPERWALALILSLSTTVILALVLDASPWGLSGPALVGSLTAITLAAALGAAFRGHRRSGRSAFSVDRVRYPLTRGGAVALVLLLPPLLALALAVAPSTPAAPSTEFFVLGSGGLAHGYPLRVVSGRPVTIEIGLVNREGSGMVYRVVIEDGAAILASIGPLELAAGATSRERVDFSVAPAPGPRDVRIRLYREADAEPYRSLRLWLVVESPSLAPERPTPAASPAAAEPTVPPPTPRPQLTLPPARPAAGQPIRLPGAAPSPIPLPAP